MVSCDTLPVDGTKIGNVPLYRLTNMLTKNCLDSAKIDPENTIFDKEKRGIIISNAFTPAGYSWGNSMTTDKLAIIKSVCSTLPSYIANKYNF